MSVVTASILPYAPRSQAPCQTPTPGAAGPGHRRRRHIVNQSPRKTSLASADASTSVGRGVRRHERAAYGDRERHPARERRRAHRTVAQRGQHRVRDAVAATRGRRAAAGTSHRARRCRRPRLRSLPRRLRPHPRPGRRARHALSRLPLHDDAEHGGANAGHAQPHRARSRHRGRRRERSSAAPPRRGRCPAAPALISLPSRALAARSLAERGRGRGAPGHRARAADPSQRRLGSPSPREGGAAHHVDARAPSARAPR